MNEFTALEINGEALSLADVMAMAKARGELGFLRAAQRLTFIRQAARQFGLEASADELQAAADAFRQKNGLQKVAALMSWLASYSLRYEDWEAMLEDDILTHHVREHVAAGQVEKTFAERRLSFDVATVAWLVVKDESLIKELRLQISEEDADFYQLARQYSIDETRHAGGYAGAIRRDGLDAAVEAGVFGAKPGAVVGPFKAEAGWSLCKVETLTRARLDKKTTEEVKHLIFEEWLEERANKSVVRVPLLEIPPEEEDQDE